MIKKELIQKIEEKRGKLVITQVMFKLNIIKMMKKIIKIILILV